MAKDLFVYRNNLDDIINKKVMTKIDTLLDIDNFLDRRRYGVDRKLSGTMRVPRLSGSNSDYRINSLYNFFNDNNKKVGF